MALQVIILAAGKGKRMLSDTPKVLHLLGGTPLLERVINTANSLNPSAVHVVYGSHGECVRQSLDHLSAHWVEQSEQLGTGHAVQQVIPFCKDDDQVLILYGDVPLISPETLQHLLESTSHSGLGLVVAERDNPAGLGRIIRDELGSIIQIVEHRDATEQQRAIREINSGIMTASAIHLKKWLAQVNNDNQQKEYYLTDIVACAVAEGSLVGGVLAQSVEEIQGVNDRSELALLERAYQRGCARKLMLSGVTVADPDRLDVRSETIEVGQDTMLDINVVLEGRIRIGKGCYVGPQVLLRDVEIKDGAFIFANSVLEGAVLGEGCRVGPFARLRPGTTLGKSAKVGNFVEVKKTSLGEGSKASHLTYLGDASIGKNVNIGAGTITCNYDGVNKWETLIEDDVFIGSNTALIAPISIGEGATIAAGSTITKAAPAYQLTVARVKAKSISEWQRPSKKKP